MEINEEQTKKLIEAYLNNIFEYHLDEIEDRKRPFGNSGYSQIFKDILGILDIEMKFTVNDEDELGDKQYQFVEDCFNSMKSFAKDKADYKLVLVKVDSSD